MIHYCKHCGTLLAEDAKVCSFCGKALETPRPEPKPAESPVDTPTEQPTKSPAKFHWQTLKEKFTKKQLLIAGGIALGVIVLAVAVYLLFLNPHIALNKYADVHNGNYRNLESLAPKEFWEQVAQSTTTSVESYINKKEESLKKTYDTLKEQDSYLYGTLQSKTYHITDTQKISEIDLNGIKDSLQKRYDIAEHRIGTAYNLIVKVVYHGSERDDTRVAYVTSIQIDGKWYLIQYMPYAYTNGFDTISDDYSVSLITTGSLG
jgi:hypothetical protein